MSPLHQRLGPMTFPAEYRRLGELRASALACRLWWPWRHGGPCGAGRHHSPAGSCAAPDPGALARRHNLCYANAPAAGRAAAGVLRRRLGRRRGAGADLRAHAARSVEAWAARLSGGWGWRHPLITPVWIRRADCWPWSNFQQHPRPVLVGQRSPSHGGRPLCRCGPVLHLDLPASARATAEWAGRTRWAPPFFFFCFFFFFPGPPKWPGAVPIRGSHSWVGRCGPRMRQLTANVQRSRSDPPGAAQAAARGAWRRGGRSQPAASKTLAAGRREAQCPCGRCDNCQRRQPSHRIWSRSRCPGASGPGQRSGFGSAPPGRCLATAESEEDRWGWLARRLSRKADQ